MEQQKLTECLREVGAELVANGKAQNIGSFVGIAMKHFATQHQLENTQHLTLSDFMSELSARLWKTGRVRYKPSAEDVLAFMLRNSGMSDRYLIDRIIH